MSRRKKFAVAAAGITLCLLFFMVAILPVLVRNKAVSTIQQTTGRTNRIEAVSINPFTLGVTIRGLEIEAKEGGPFVSIGSLRTSLSLASLYRRALILSEVTIDAPSLKIVRNAPNLYNFTDIIERVNAAKKPKPAKETQSQFSINNITIRNGALDFDDQAVAGKPKHTVRQFDLSVPFISNIPYLVDKYIDPKLSAVINGAPFSFAGKLKPLSKTMETAVTVNLKDLNLPQLAAYLPQKPPADLASGTLSVTTDISYRISTDKKPELVLKGQVKSENLAVDLRDGAPLLKLPMFYIKASRLEVFARKFEIEKIALDGFELFASRSRQGKWMYESLIPKKPGTSTAKSADVKKSTGKDVNPLVTVNSLDFRNGQIHFNDAVPKGGFKTSLSEIDLSLNDFTTAAGSPAKYDLSLMIDDEATFYSDGSFTSSPLAVKSSSELIGFELKKGWPYLANLLTAPVKGGLDLSGDMEYDQKNGLKVHNGSVKVKNLSTRYGQKEGLDLALLSIDGTAFDQKKNNLMVDEIRISKGDISLSRENDGSLSPLSLLHQGKSTATGTVPSIKTAPSAPAKASVAGKGNQGTSAFSYQLKHVQVDKLNLTFTDKSRSGSPKFNLSNTNLTLSNLNGPRFTPAQLRFSSIFGKKSPIKAAGQLTPLPFRYKGDFSVSQLPIRDFEDYYPANLKVFVIGGYLDTSLKLDVALRDGKPVGSFEGHSGVRAFHSIDTIAEEDLLKWESLQLDSFKGNLEPFNLAIRQIALNGVYSRIIIRKDGTLNLQNLVEKPETETEASTGPKVSAAAVSETVNAPSTAPPPPAAGKRQVTIDAVTIQDGTVAFTDDHLSQQFATTFFNLGGRISGLSSEETKLADVDLRGNLENHSPLQITGSINPLRDDLFVDLKIAFRDIELSPITPYSGTYLGYAVEKGKLFLDLKYHIEKKVLNSTNRIFIDQFTFGNKVESKKATSLPVRLALALLKDRKGEIHLDVPVTGRTDDPTFSIWRLVFQVFKNLIIKAATSPFSLLSSMFGGGTDLSTVQFQPGSSVLPPQEETKLVALAKALSDRPALKIELKGFVEREKDAEGYRVELLNRKIRNEKFLAKAKDQKLAEGETAENTKVSHEEASTYLKAVYKKENFAKPRNVLGLVKSLPDDEMRKLIIANTHVGETELQALASERAMAVMDYLVKKGNVAAARIFLKKTDIYKAPEKGGENRSRVELNIIA